jgi:hypothetical protein
MSFTYSFSFDANQNNGSELVVHMQNSLLDLEHFKDIWLDDPFFDSLKADYAEFGEWFKKKATYLHNASSNQCRVSKLRSFSGFIAW